MDCGLIFADVTAYQIDLIVPIRNPNETNLTFKSV